jgi:uncharacterized protein (DUF2141 family)
MTRPAFALVLLAYLAGGCAQVREVTGGPQDTAPPVLLEAEPPQLSTRFTGRRIVLHFDERVKVVDAVRQLLISPPLASAPELHVQGGNAVVIELKEALAPATTYSFNLGDAVVDLTEGNPATGLTYVMSTGDQLDSGAVAGRVMHAASGKPAAGVQVLLHAAEDTAGIRQGRPLYAARTDGEGRFTARHLRNGAYTVHALVDRNGNLRYDLPLEEVAFFDGPVEVPGSKEPTLWLFQETPAAQQVMDQRVGPDRDWRFVMARAAGEPRLRDIDRTGGDLSWAWEFNPTRDSLRAWPDDTTALEGRRFELLENGTVLDTFTYRVREPMPFVLGARLVWPGNVLRLEAERPLAGTDTSRMAVQVGDRQVPVVVVPDTACVRCALVNLEDPSGKEVRIVLYPKALKDIYGSANDTLSLRTAKPGPDQLGILQLHVVVDSNGIAGPWALMLLDGQERPVRTVTLNDLSQPVVLADLTPGTYGVKLVEDLNGNGKPDPGRLRGGVRPERAWRMGNTLLVRAGWEVEHRWDLEIR